MSCRERASSSSTSRRSSTIMVIGEICPPGRKLIRFRSASHVPSRSGKFSTTHCRTLSPWAASAYSPTRSPTRSPPAKWWTAPRPWSRSCLKTRSMPAPPASVSRSKAAAASSFASSTTAAAWCAMTPCSPSSAMPPPSSAPATICSPSRLSAFVVRRCPPSPPYRGSKSRPAPPKSLPAPASRSSAAVCTASKTQACPRAPPLPSAISSSTPPRAANFSSRKPPSSHTSPHW